MQLEKVEDGYKITCKFASREGKSNEAVFFWDGSNLKVEKITDMDYLESLSKEVSQYLKKVKEIL